MTDPRVDYWFRPPFSEYTDDRGEVHVVDADHRYVCTFNNLTQLPLSDTGALEEEKNRWVEFAQWLAERMNT